MVDKTHYTDGSELTYKEKNHLIAFCTLLENYNDYYRTPPNYGEYVPLVHVLNHDNFYGDTLVRYFTITTSVHLLHTSKTSTSLLTTKLLLCFSTENPDGLCASSDVLQWSPWSSEPTARSSYGSHLCISNFWNRWTHANQRVEKMFGHS